MSLRTTRRRRVTEPTSDTDSRSLALHPRRRLPRGSPTHPHQSHIQVRLDSGSVEGGVGEVGVVEQFLEDVPKHEVREGVKIS